MDLPTTTRRTMLLGTTALALPGTGLSASHGRSAEQTLADVLARCADEILDDHPQSATSLGLDSGARAGLRARLDDRSEAGVAAQHRRCAARLAVLEAITAAPLAAPSRLTLDTVIHAHRLGVAGSVFATGNHTLQAAMTQTASPYVISQMTGAFSEVPDLLHSEHSIAGRDDVQAYLARLDAYASALDAETQRLAADRQRGVTPPGFVLATLARQMQDSLAHPADRSELVTSLATRMQAARLEGREAAQATRLVEQRVQPALQRQLDAVRVARTRAPAEGGLARLPGGEREYAWFLAVATASELTPDQIHRMGLETSRDIEAQMDKGLRSHGMTRGSVGERMRALAADPAQRFPNDDAGRAAAIAHVNSLVEKARAAMPGLSRLGLKAAVSVKRVPPATERGAAGAYMNPGSLDGSRPAQYYLNLRDTATWPRWTLPTLTYHETLPGHVWQEAHGIEHQPFPLVRALVRFNASSEGWALYAEQLADEQGWYAHDPLGRLGYLQAMQLRASRLVVDTGLHAFGWTRDRAIDWMTRATGRPRIAMASEVDRYCVKPGQACGYMVGLQEILRLRAQSQSRLGERFDLRAFNDFIVTSGNVPFRLLANLLH